jgi:tetrahydroxynaphthalene reductase
MSSNTAKDFSVPKHSLYSGSKGAIDSFVRVLSKDCGHKKITVNAVAPGGTVTDMFHDVSQHYIPGGEKYTPAQRQEVSLFNEFRRNILNNCRWLPMLRR